MKRGSFQPNKMTDINPKMHRGFKIRKTSVQVGHKSNVTPIHNNQIDY
tara:strand:+ start:607 stop:750 length:144 start_codon:yes stop_codon:yes gene_type:complete